MKPTNLAYTTQSTNNVEHDRETLFLYNLDTKHTQSNEDSFHWRKQEVRLMQSRSLHLLNCVTLFTASSRCHGLYLT